MSPEKPGELLPDDAGPEMRKLAAAADDTVLRMDSAIEKIESDIQQIEQIESDMRRDSLM